MILLVFVCHSFVCMCVIFRHPQPLYGRSGGLSSGSLYVDIHDSDTKYTMSCYISQVHTHAHTHSHTYTPPNLHYPPSSV